MSILITGGDGFIGRNLVKKLIKTGIKIIIIDNNITSYPIKYNSNNITTIREDISFLNIDKIPKISLIIHLASVASPLVYIENPSSVLNPNTLGTRKVIEIAKRDNAKIIFSSTSEVYGSINSVTYHNGIKEDEVSKHHLLTRRSAYRSAKIFAEELLNLFNIEGGDVRILRLFNVYGYGMDTKNTGYGRVIPNFFDKISKKENITIFGDGEQIRSFLWIDDAIDILLKILLSKNNNNFVMNVGNPDIISINDLATKIFNIFGNKFSANYIPIDKDDTLWRKPNIEKVKLEFGWKPKISIDEGIKLITKEYLKNV